MTDLKYCPKCKQTKACSSFYKDRTTHDGLQAYCIACRTTYRESPVGRTAQRRADRKRGSQRGDQGYQARSRRHAQRRYRENHPNKTKAQSAISNAIFRGRLTSAAEHKCAECGRDAEQYHHPSYEQRNWLRVIPLCVACHNRVHRTS